MDADFKEQPLSDISEQLIGKWIGITSMYSSGMLYKCLDVFSNNTSLVFWLKEATNGTYMYVCIMYTPLQRYYSMCMLNH